MSTIISGSFGVLLFGVCQWTWSQSGIDITSCKEVKSFISLFSVLLLPSLNVVFKMEQSVLLLFSIEYLLFRG